MAISVSFGGATIYRSGSYSEMNIDVGGGFPIGPAGLVVVFGEADAGKPGALETDISANNFTADQLPTIRSKYRSGPIVDSAGFLFAPAADAAIPNGAQTVWFYKTNASTQASLALSNTYGTIKSLEWGIGGNRINVQVQSVAEVAPVVNGTVISTFGAALNAATFVIHEDGGAAKTITLSSTPANHSDIVTLVSELSTLFTAATVTSTVAQGVVPHTLVITHAMDAMAYQKGYGKSIELSGTGLTALGLTAGFTTSTVEPTALIQVNQPRDLISESETVGGNAILNIGYNLAGATAATVTIDANKITLTPTPGTASVFQKANYATISELAADIDLLAGWSATISDAQYNQLSPDVLDLVTGVGALSSSTFTPAMIKKDAAEVQSMFSDSSLVELNSPAEVGLPAALTTTSLANGAKGGTSSAEIVNALAAFAKFRANFVVPLFSRDATDDISDGLTDGTSTYTIDAIHQAVKTHISLLKTVKKRNERQGYLSLKRSFSDCLTQAGIIADGREQLVIQDTRQNDAAGNIKWFQPWALAAMMAGARSGAPIGEPLTFKFMNVSGIRQTAQPMSTPEANIHIDFDPDTMAEQAIIGGITFLEPRQTGGFRVVVDNTTYGRDANFVWNRANVIYAADTAIFNLRSQLEDIYVGKKNTIKPAEVAATAASILTQLQAQGITVATATAPNGFKNLSVRIEGNTIYVSVTIVIVEGIDFVLETVTIERASAA